MAGWIKAALAGVVLAGALSAAFAQAPEGAGLRSANEIIFARRILMNGISQNNDVLHEAMDGVLEWREQEVRGRLGSISAMLLAFPHLYRPDTNIWSPELEAADPAGVSLSLPAVWENWSDFVSRSEAASMTALEASLAATEEDINRMTVELEVQCDSCHALYRQDRPAAEFPELGAPAAMPAHQ